MIGVGDKMIAKASWHIALLLVMFIFSNIAISSLLFIAHVSISPLQPITATLATIVFALILLRKGSWRLTLGVLGGAALLIAASIFITSITSDDTVDTHAYHQTAVGAMRYGWNPVYENIGDFNDSGKLPFKLQNTYYEKWDNHYPKAHWIFAANIYSVTNKIETGRSMVLLVVFALFFLTLHYALTRFSLGMSLVLAFLVALNPISVMQLFSYYNDGMLGNFVLMLVLLLTMLLDKKYAAFSWVHYLFIIMALAVMINLKFTGLVYAGVCCFVYFAYILADKSCRKKYTKPLLVSGTAALLIGLFIIGLSVYPKNFVTKGSPFYPLIGGDSKVDIITPNEPYQFRNMNRVTKLLVSNFSETDNISENSVRNPELKVPFTFDMEELPYLSSVDPRIAGYGVWFGGILAISISWLVYLGFKFVIKKEWRNFWLMAVPLIPVAIIALALAESWWARYLPQMFLVPAVALVSMLLLKRNNLANVLMFALLFNTILTLSLQISGQEAGLKYRASEEKAVDALLENGKYTPKLYLGDFGGLAYRYYEKYGRVIILSEKLNDDDSKGSLKLAKDIIVYR